MTASKGRASWRSQRDLLLIEAYRQPSEGYEVPDVLGHGDPAIRFVGAVTIPGDEQVLYLVAAPSVAAVEGLLRRAGLDSIRIVPAAWTEPDVVEPDAVCSET